MRIGMILMGDYPPDIRVEKEATALLVGGHEVFLLCMNPSPQAPAEETPRPGLTIIRVSPHKASKLDSVIASFFNIYRPWEPLIAGFITRCQPDALHVHDFPLVNTALRCAKRENIPVVADLHENMPAAFQIWRQSMPPLRRLRDSLKHNYALMRWQERAALPKCAQVIVVVPEAAERLYRYGLPEQRITVVSNTEDDSTFPVHPPDPELAGKYSGRWIVSYTGGLGPHRGVDTAVRAVVQAAGSIPNLLLLIIGAKNDRNKVELERLIASLEATELVSLVDWIPSGQVSDYIALSQACLVPHNDSEHTQTTLPHKLFQYMISGKPVVVSDVRPLKRVVTEAQAGLVFQADQPASLANCLVRLYRDPALQARLGDNGRKAAHHEYSWKNDAARLLEVYNRVGSSRTRS